MHRRTRVIASFGIATACSAVLTALFLHIALLGIPGSVQDAGVGAERISVSADASHHAPLSTPSVHSAPDADPEIEEVHSEIVDERAQWQLRRAYSMTVSDLAIRTPVWLPSRQYWDAREWSLLEEQMQIGLLYGAVAYPHSSRPGAGPLVIAGHSSPPTERATESQYGSVFAHLPDVSIAEEIVLTDGEEKFRYAVTEMFIVASTDTSILDLTRLAPDTLTVITCYPVGTTRQRFVVRAKLLPNNE